MKGLVIFDTTHGNTRAVAEALSESLRGSGIAVDVLYVKDVKKLNVKEYDFLVLGSPTRFGTMSLAMKGVTGKVKGDDWAGKPFAAFDTQNPPNLEKQEWSAAEKIAAIVGVDAQAGAWATELTRGRLRVIAFFLALIVGLSAWFVVRYLVGGIYTVDQNERAVKTVFGRAQRLGTATVTDGELGAGFDADERARYDFPLLRVIPPGGPYFKMPWEKIYKVSVATETVSMAYDPESATANDGGTVLEAVTKDQLNTGLTGQIRYQVAERNLRIAPALQGLLHLRRHAQKHHTHDGPPHLRHICASIAHSLPAECQQSRTEPRFGPESGRV